MPQVNGQRPVRRRARGRRSKSQASIENRATATVEKKHSKFAARLAMGFALLQWQDFMALGAFFGGLWVMTPRRGGL